MNAAELAILLWDMASMDTYDNFKDKLAEHLRDAERYRWLRDTLHGAKAGGGVEVNDQLQVYEEPVPGEEVRIYWYLHTPVGFHEVMASTLDEAIDEAMQDGGR